MKIHLKEPSLYNIHIEKIYERFRFCLRPIGVEFLSCLAVVNRKEGFEVNNFLNFGILLILIQLAHQSAVYTVNCAY